MWGMIISAAASGVASYASSRNAEKGKDKDAQTQMALLEKAYELDKKKKEDQRAYMAQGYKAYAPYGAGGKLDPFAQYRPTQGPQGTSGLLSNSQLNPSSFFQNTRG